MAVRTMTSAAAAAALLLLALLVVPVADGQADANSLMDANALIKFKSTIWFDPLTVLSTWTIAGGIGSHACGFTGIVCDTLGKFRVVEVRLGSQRLRGIIQQSLRNLTMLVSFNLSTNEFMGDLPSGFGDLSLMQMFDVSHNLITGYIPTDIGNLPSLQYLNVGSNQLTGNLIALGTPNLMYMDMSNNTLEGSIPSGYGYLPLQSLNLGGNLLTGEIPKKLGSGRSSNIRELNLSINFLTGKIPKALGKCPLTLLDLEGNSLRGLIPPTDVMRKFYPDGFFPGNLLLCGPIVGTKCPAPPVWWKAIVGVFGPIFFVIAVIKLYNRIPPGEYTSFSIIKMTDDFNNSNLIGVGGLCSVYKGYTLRRHKLVAVKRLRPEYYRHKKKYFQLERRHLFHVKHPNIVRVSGSCCTKALKVLVLEHMSNGNLSMHLHGAAETGTILPWKVRLDTAAGVAQGLAYLQGEWTGARAMHCDVKSTSILFNEKFHAKITDVRLASVTTQDTINDMGYMAPEYLLTRTCTSAAEVYSFGTLVLELLTGIRPGSGPQGSLQGIVKQAFPYNVQSIVDPKLQDQIVEGGPVLEQMTTCAKIGLLCTNELANERPSMKDVLYMFGQAYSPPRATVPLPGWVMLALGAAQDDHTERTPWTMVPLPLWLMLLLGLAQDNSSERLPTSLLLE